MPRMDKTGPEGLGARTGGGRGICGGAPAGGNYGCGGRQMKRGGGRRGRGMGFGTAGFGAVEGDREAFLKAESTHLKNRLDFIQKELDNITTDSATTEEN